MSNQSPAEGLRQQILAYVGYGADDVKFADEIMAGVTAYAATVEREARIDELQTYFDTFNDNNFTPMRTINYCERRLTTLQGPQGKEQ